jgi:hypothetical protein
MTLNANDYRLRIPYIISLTKDKTADEIFDFIGVLAIATNIHIVLVSYYIGELYGFDSRLYAFISRLEKFYTVKEVLNVNK